jgi:predicted transcriptional regulator of viral defense system
MNQDKDIILNINKPAKTKRVMAKYNPDEIVDELSKLQINKRYKSAPKPLFNYVIGKESYDSMVKYLKQKPTISITDYNTRMSDLYNKVGKCFATPDNTGGINQLNNYLRYVNVELVYEDE